MTEQSALDIAVAFLDAWTEGDFKKAGSHLADDFVFEGPIAHYTSASDFLAGSKRFIETIRPGWAKVAAFGDDREALLLYDLTHRSGSRMRIADYYTVSNGKIQTEAILWDTHGSPFRQNQ
jgi:ketosteroid isomerase-like protein